jgi:hypothetical protein
MTSHFRNFLLAQTVIWLWLTPCGTVGAQRVPAPQAHAIFPSGGAGKPALQHRAQDLPSMEQEAGPQLSPKQRRELQKSNFEKMKHDADDLAALAKALQEELDKSSQHVFSLQIVDKAEKIEKLAKKIKAEAKGFY